MTYYNIINDNQRVQCTVKGSKYSYDLMENDKSFNIGVTLKSPLELTRQSSVGKTIYDRIKQNDDNCDIEKEFRLILEKMDKDVHKQLSDKDKESQKELDKIDEEYEELYSEFEYNLEKYGLTPLQYIIFVFDSLGVNASLEMTKSFCGYLQTFLGLKGTNVIGVGDQSSGKTHCIENPLDCIPDEKIHRGTYTVASFFTEFSGRDLTGHIFYLGDMGGVNDDAKTIEFRDELKKLSTDGFTSRTLKNEDGEVITETITGKPAIVYTTVSEEMINSQEASRSMLIMPPDVIQRRLVAYDSFLQSPGVLYSLYEEIENNKKVIKGFVWNLSVEITNVEMENPFKFCVQRYLTNARDFNRKIKEFDELLKIICILNNSFHLTHDYYFDKETQEPVETKLYIPSKQDVIDALNLFEGSTGLLPSEIALTKGLLKYYEECPSMFTEITDEMDDDISFEEVVYQNAVRGDYAVIDEVTDETEHPYLTDYDTKVINDDGEECVCFFTIDDVKRGHTNERWYKGVKEELSAKLNKLHSFGILIKLGQNKQGRNVYAFAENIRQQVESIEPVFGSKDIRLAKDIFIKRYPTLVDEYEDYVNRQAKLRTKSTNFEFKENKLYDNLFWNKLQEE